MGLLGDLRMIASPVAIPALLARSGLKTFCCWGLFTLFPEKRAESAEDDRRIGTLHDQQLPPEIAPRLQPAATSPVFAWRRRTSLGESNFERDLTFGVS